MREREGAGVFITAASGLRLCQLVLSGLHGVREWKGV